MSSDASMCERAHFNIRDDLPQLIECFSNVSKSLLRTKGDLRSQFSSLGPNDVAHIHNSGGLNKFCAIIKVLGTYVAASFSALWCGALKR